MTTKQLLNYELNHAHGGGPYVFVHDVGDGYVRIAGPHVQIGNQAFLAWKKKLSVYQVRIDPKNMASPLVDSTIPTDVRPALDEIRNGLSSGKLEVVNTRIQLVK